VKSLKGRTRVDNSSRMCRKK